ncbi:MAG: hypothetical protein QXS29_06135 [Nitrososphaeria archaeon]
MKAQLQSKMVRQLTILAIVLLAFAIPFSICYADQKITVPICSQQSFKDTAWTTKSFTVDVSKLSNAKQVTIYFKGTTSDDPYVRYLVIAIDGQVVNPQDLPSDRKFDNTITKFTDVIKSSAELRYDVTNLVKGKNSVVVKIGITTQAGYTWTVDAAFEGATADQVTIPVGPDIIPGTPEGGLTLPTGTALVIAGIACFAIAAYMKKR